MRLQPILVAVVASAAAAARVQRPVDDPLACPWDVRICVDGSWVYREPERDCAFRECWSSYVPPPEASPAPAR